MWKTGSVGKLDQDTSLLHRIAIICNSCRVNICEAADGSFLALSKAEQGNSFDNNLLGQTTILPSCFICEVNSQQDRV